MVRGPGADTACACAWKIARSLGDLHYSGSDGHVLALECVNLRVNGVTGVGVEVVGSGVAGATGVGVAWREEGMS